MVGAPFATRRSMDWNSGHLSRLITAALEEDHAWEDATTAATLDPKLPAEARLLAQQDLVLAGVALPALILNIFAARRGEAAATCDPLAADGDLLAPGSLAARLRGPARHLLACERVMLNFLQHLSGVATLTRRYAAALAGTAAVLLDTRKTLPGFRELDKYAVTCGGGTNHRAHLADAILIKNNHAALARGLSGLGPGGGAAEALARARARRSSGLAITVEARSLQDLEAILPLGADRILLDNFSPEETRAAVLKTAGRAALESSGGITLANIRSYAEAGVQFISVGALTHSAPAVSLALRLSPTGPGRES